MSNRKTVWRYFRGPNETDPVDFATQEEAKQWLAENDPEGVAFQYEIQDDAAVERFPPGSWYGGT